MAQRKTLLRALTSLSLSVLLIFTTIYNPINVEAKLENDTKIMSSQEGKEYTQFSSSTLVNNSTVNSSVYQDNISYTLNYSGIYQASKDFNVEQGYNGWYYTEKTESGYTNMAWDGVSAWKGASPNCYIWANAQHPDMNDSVRKWVAPYSGTVLITSNGNIRKSNTNGGDGVKARLYKNSGLLWESYIAGTDGVGVSFPPRVVEVAAGDAIYFEINKNGDINCDATIWDPIIEYKGPILYQASKDFNVEQGYNGWYYTEKTEGGYINMAWDGVSAWKGTGSYCYIWANAQHSDINDSVRKWIAPYSGTVLITSNGNIRKSNTNGGDGVKARLYKNSGLLWESYIAGTDGVGVSFPPRVVEVTAGDAIYFEINKNGDINCDATIWDPVIEYKTGITYIYDNQNRLLKVLMNGNPLLRFEYDKCGNILKRYR